ncbi:hypothetical protein O181_053764, partial [Austropuccinia psidii MF-1]|nr:hypothetical protein [Austropuccinia psidii MF-1]
MIKLLKDSSTIEKLPEERFQMIINHDTTMTGQVINGLISLVHTEPRALISTGDIWHCRLGHPSNQAIKILGLPPSSSTNRGGEFENKNFAELAASCGFVHLFAPTSTPEHNGFAERANCTILNKARCLLLTSKLPRSYWAGAVNTALFLSNLMPTPSRDNLSPFWAWSSKPSRIKSLKTFGCKAFILVHKNRREWKDKAVIITRHALSVEDSFPSLAANPEIHDCSRWVDINKENNEAFFDCEYIEPEHINDTSDVCHLDSSPSVEQAPKISENPNPCHPKNHCRRKAISGSKSSFWLEAIRRELNAMQKLEFGDVIPLEKDFKLAGTTWVFRQKRNELNEVIEYKARLFAQGFSQKFGQDYLKTFAPTGCLHSLRTLIAFSAAHNLDFQQLDIRSAFLNAPLDEKVYLSIPQGLQMCRKTHCLRLKKPIYGLKQAPIAWYKRLTSWLEGLGFNASISDPCVFFRKTHPPIWLFFHVYDITVFGSDLFSFKEDIKKEFEVKDLGKADQMLGIKLIHSDNSVILSQAHYAESVLALYGRSECKPMMTPMVPNTHLEESNPKECSRFEALNTNYRSAVGSLNYLSVPTRPDISFAVSFLSQFLKKPGIHHWNAFLHVLRYLRGTVDYSLHYMAHGVGGLCAYSDADWGNCRQTRRSITGFVISFKDFLVIWKTHKQPSVSLSTAEAEYKALTDLSTEVLWLR